MHHQFSRHGTFCRAHALARPEAPLSRDEWEATIARFDDVHEELHTYASRDEEPILRAVRVTAIGVRVR